MYHLSKRADTILKTAKALAHEYGLEHVGTEHILLAIVQDPEGHGAKALLAQGVTEYRVKAEVDERFKERSRDTWVIGRLPGTPHFRDVLAKAANEASGKGNWQICSVHLLLALLAEKESFAYRVLKKLGVSAEAVRKTLSEQLTSATR